jgi:RIO kinase 2
LVADIYMAQLYPPPDEEVPPPAVLKVHRLGRISFRKIKEKRDYLGNRKSAPNWMYLSRLAAKKEWQFLQILHQHGFPVPTPVAHSRHSILMSRIDGYPLRQIVDLPEEHVASLFASLMALIVRLARAGLIHCDFNEFNIMVREVQKEEEGDEYETGKERMTVWGTGKGLTRDKYDEDDGEEEEYQLKPGERIEKGNGFERIYRVQEGDKSSDESEEDEKEDDEDEKTDSPDEFDEDGTNEGLKIELSDGSAIEPILIDFPQMVSVEHANAE